MVFMQANSRWLRIALVLFLVGCQELDDARGTPKRPKTINPKLVRKKVTTATPSPTNPLSKKSVPLQPLPDGPYAALEAKSAALFGGTQILIARNKATQKKLFLPINAIEVDLKTTKDKPPHTYGIVKLLVTQSLGGNTPDVQHEFVLKYDYVAQQWLQQPETEHAWFTIGSKTEDNAEAIWDYDVDFEIQTVNPPQ
jgi:hypothetical protein